MHGSGHVIHVVRRSLSVRVASIDAARPTLPVGRKRGRRAAPLEEPSRLSAGFPRRRSLAKARHLRAITLVRRLARPKGQPACPFLKGMFASIRRRPQDESDTRLLKDCALALPRRNETLTSTLRRATKLQSTAGASVVRCIYRNAACLMRNSHNVGGSSMGHDGYWREEIAELCESRMAAARAATLLPSRIGS